MMDVEALIAAGYARVSNRHRIVSRIDRKDWKKHMAERMYPPEYGHTQKGYEWIDRIGDRAAANHYRRVYSRDDLSGFTREDFRKFPASDGGPTEFMSKADRHGE